MPRCLWNSRDGGAEERKNFSFCAVKPELRVYRIYFSGDTTPKAQFPIQVMNENAREKR